MSVKVMRRCLPRVAWIVLVGILLRIILIPYFTTPFDFTFWLHSANDVLSGLTFYERGLFTYPPVWGFFFIPFVVLLSLITGTGSFSTWVPVLQEAVDTLNVGAATITSPTFNIAIKAPLLILDILMMLTIYKVVKERNGIRAANASAALWFLNPLVIYESSIHGMFDVIPTYFLLLSILFVMAERPLLSGISWGLGVLSKLFPVYIGPLLLAIIYYKGERNKVRQFSLFFAGAALSSAITILPLLLTGDFDTMFQTIFKRMEGVSSFGGITPLVLIDRLLGINLQSAISSNYALFALIGNTLIILSLLAAILVVRKSKGDIAYKVFPSVFLILLVVLWTNTVTNAHYLIWVLPFMILVYGLNNKPRCALLIVIMSVMATLFEIGLSGPHYLAAPLAVYTDVISIQWVVEGIYYYHEASLFGLALKDMVYAISVIGGSLALIVFAYDSLLSLRGVKE